MWRSRCLRWWRPCAGQARHLEDPAALTSAAHILPTTAAPAGLATLAQPGGSPAASSKPFGALMAVFAEPSQPAPAAPSIANAPRATGKAPQTAAGAPTGKTLGTTAGSDSQTETGDGHPVKARVKGLTETTPSPSASASVDLSAAVVAPTQIILPVQLATPPTAAAVQTAQAAPAAVHNTVAGKGGASPRPQPFSGVPTTALSRPDESAAPDGDLPQLPGRDDPEAPVAPIQPDAGDRSSTLR